MQPEEELDDHERFAALLARHNTHLMGFILSLLPHWADAEDVLQQTSVVMWRKFGEFEPGTSFVNWGCQIARYHVLNYVRKQSRERLVFGDELIHLMADEGAADMARLERQRHVLELCLEKLDEAGRSLLARCYTPEATIKSVAEELGRTPNSVYKGLNRLREALLRCVQITLAQEGI